jgi:glycerol-3-phosphate dehydrogenase (NAD(P)+)
MTRGLHEITRLGIALGASPQTFAGLTGMGDLFVTCMSRHSRNRLLGEKLGRGMTLEAALGEMVMVAEGVRTAKAARDLARRVGVEAPIVEQVNRILFEGVSAKECLKALMARDAKPESLEP